MKSTFKSLFALALLAGGGINLAHAATITWTNGTATAVWTNLNNWSDGLAPSGANNYYVTNAASPSRPDVASVNGTPFSVVFGGNSLTLSNNATLRLYRNYNGGTATEYNTFTNLSINGANITVQSAVGSLTEVIGSPNPVALTLANKFNINCGSYSEGLTITNGLTGSGTLAIARNNAGSAANFTLTGNSSGYSGAVSATGTSVARTLTLNMNHASGWGGGNLTLNTNTVLNFGAGLTNPAPQVNLSGTNATLNVNNASTVGSLAGVAGSTVNLNQSLTLVANASATFAGTLTGAGSLTKNGTNKFTLSGGNTFTGGTFINNGPTNAGSGTAGTAAIQVSNAGALGGGAVTIGGAVNNLRALEFNLTGGATVTNAINLPTSGAGQVGIQGNSSSSSYTLSGQISGGWSGLTFFLDMGNGSSSGVTRWSNPGNNFIAGSANGITVNRGVLAITADGCLGDAGNTLRLWQGSQSGGLRFDAPNINVAHAVRLDDHCRLDVLGDNDGSGTPDTANDATISGNISGTGTGTDNVQGGQTSGGNSVGSLTLSGNNSFTMALNVNANTKLIAASATALGAISAGTAVSAGGTLAFENVGAYANAEPVTLNGAGVQSGGSGVGALENLAGNNTFNGPITLATDTTIGITAGSLALGGAIGGGGALTYNGNGTLTLGVVTNTGSTTITGGAIVAGSLTTADGAVLSVPDVAGSFTANNLQLGTAAGCVVAITSFAGAAGAPIVATNLATAGTVTLSVSLSGSLTTGVPYPLIQYSGGIGGAGFGAFALRGATGVLTNDTANSVVAVILTSTSAVPLVWTGAVNSNWDVNTTTNWTLGGVGNVFLPNDAVQFDDTANAGATNVTLNVGVAPASVTVANSALNYTISGTGSMIGGMGLTKSGPGSLTLGTTNSYTGGTTVSGGTLNLNNAAGAGTGAIALGANTLGMNIGAATLPNAITGAGTINVTETANANSYFGGDLSGFTGTINLPTNPGGTAKAGIASGTVNLNSAATVNVAGGGTFYLNGAAVNVAATVEVAGSGNSENYGALRVDGGSTVSGPVVLTGNATIGMNNGAGSISGVISDGGNGYGFTKVGGQALTLSGNNTYTGATVVTNGTVNVTGDESAATGGWVMPVNYATATVNFQPGSTVLVASNKFVQIGSSPSAGTPNTQTINANGVVTNNGSLLVARGGVLNVNSGATWVQNGGATNSPPPLSGYGSSVTIAAGGTFIYNGPGSLKVEPSSTNFGIGTFTVAGTVITSQGFERTINTSAANPVLALNGGTIQLAANISALASSPLVTTGGVLTVQMAAGGGTFDTAGFSTAISNAVSGAGSLTKIGAGTLSLPFTNTYIGATYVNGGTLALSGGGGIASSASLAIAAGADFDVSTITPASYTLAGPLTVTVDKTSGTTTQGQVQAGTTALVYGGNLTVNKTGPDALAAGDSFPLFVSTGGYSGNFSSLTLPSLTSGLVWDTNDLATAGVLDVYAFTATPLVIATPTNTAATVAALKLANHVSSGKAASAYPTNWTATASTPVNGGAVVVNPDGSLTYTPGGAANVNGGTDSFTVTFNDGHGAQTMAVSVSVGTGNGLSPNLLVSGVVGTDFVLKFAGVPGTAYTVETNGVISGPGWAKLGNFTTPTNGIIAVTNSTLEATNLFFRTVYPSY